MPHRQDQEEQEAEREDRLSEKQNPCERMLAPVGHVCLANMNDSSFVAALEIGINGKIWLLSNFSYIFHQTFLSKNRK